MRTSYNYRPLVDGFSRKFNLQEEQKMIRRFDKDILAEIKKRSKASSKSIYCEFFT
ncbi:hypothetical protein ACNG35_002429 [Enterococcus hirae]